MPLPRGITALHWLQGQGQAEQARIYFSPRQSSAPGTQGAAAAEVATAGAGPVAGLTSGAALTSLHLKEKNHANSFSSVAR